MKKYYSYFIKQNRTKSVNFLVANAMAPLNHLFGNHDFCSLNWYSYEAAIEKTNKDETVDIVDKQMKQMKEGYYCSMDKDKLLF